MISLAQKKVVVTAAAQGIGGATAQAFAKEGARVWATDISHHLDIPSLPKLPLLPDRCAAIWSYRDILFGTQGF